MPNIPNIVTRSNDRITAAVERFVAEVDSRLEAAQLIVMARLGKAITEVDAKIVADAKTIRALQKIDRMFEDAMTELHYPELVDAFVAQFGRSGFQTLTETVSALGLRPLKLTAKTMDALTAGQVTAADNLEGFVKVAAENVKRRATFSIGALTTRDLAQVLAGGVKSAFGNIRTVADTAMTKFLRTVQRAGYDQIEKNGTELKYRYVGPIDSLVSHKLCLRLTKTPDSLYTRAEIDAMTGDLPDVFTSGGGWNCRHWFVVGAVNGREIGGAA